MKSMAMAWAALAAAVVLGAGSRSAMAWSYEGHLLVGEIAWQQLSDADKAAVTALLKSHPHYSLYLTKDAPAPAATQPGAPVIAATPQNLDELAFVKAATWPDAVRPSTPQYPPLILDPAGEKAVTQYHHAEWHYLDLADVAPGDPHQDMMGKNFEPENGNALSTIDTMEKGLAKPGDARERAVDLAWLEHLVGDIHQPMHAVTYVSDQLSLSKGDKGGNSIHVSPVETLANGERRITTLHSFWDDAVGSVDMKHFGTASLPELRAKAQGYIAANPRASFPILKTDTTPDSWAHESFDLARADAYADNKLFQWPKTKTGAYELTPEYEATARKVAEERVVLAGYRLADTIHTELAAEKKAEGK